MSWQKMRIPGVGQGESLPGHRGRYLLWLEPPYVEGEGHYVHFSWKEGSFCIRDYIAQMERRQDDSGVTATDIWKAASHRIPAKGELYVPVEKFEFWTAKLTELSESHRQGRTSSHWSQLSSKFAPKAQQAEHDGESADCRKGNGQDVYRSFISFWRKSAGFDVIERTVGCSARYQGEPLLWVYPTYFQIAPRGKGNAHHAEVRNLRDRYFPELSEGNIRFDSAHFSWDRFQPFVTDVQEMIQNAGGITKC